MANQKDVYNQLLARLVHKQAVATRDQIRAAMGRVTPDKDLGQVLIEDGTLDFENYLKFHNYIHKLFSSDAGKAKIREILGSRSGREVPGRLGNQSMSATMDGSRSRTINSMDETIARTQTQQRQATPFDRTKDRDVNSLDTTVARNILDSTEHTLTQTDGRRSYAEAEPGLYDQTVDSGEATVDRGPQAVPSQVKTAATHAEDDPVLPGEWRGNDGWRVQPLAAPTALMAASPLQDILLFTRKHKASDVHLSPGSPIILRRFGKLKPVTKDALTAEAIRTILNKGLPSEQMEIFKATGDVEFAHTLPGGGRYRVALVKQRFGWELTARVIPQKIHSFSESGLPEKCAELTRWATGMVLITGPMGCGKTTTLTTLVDMINRERKDHIITIEQPVEVIYQPSGCQITQREINRHTLSQGAALRGALRQDPDIIIISELRDVESISLAVSAAETGHLVLATMNTANAQRTINRLIDAFPPDEQDVVRNMISETLRGVISQQLVPLKDGTGVVPAYEVLLVTKAISNLIRKNNLHQLPSAMVTGRGNGMVLLDDSLKNLLQQGVIDGEEAFYRASDQRQFKQYAPAALKEIV